MAIRTGAARTSWKESDASSPAISPEQANADLSALLVPNGERTHGQRLAGVPGSALPRNGRAYAAHAAGAAGRGRTASADRLRECGEPSAGQVQRPRARDRGSLGAGRGTRPHYPAVADGEPGDRSGRRRARARHSPSAECARWWHVFPPDSRGPRRFVWTRRSSHSRCWSPCSPDCCSDSSPR